MKIDISYGNGGKETSELIHNYFAKYIGNEHLSKMEDATVLPSSQKIAFSTDSFVVKPIFFNGGDIGRLAVCGTVNDLLMVGAVPKYISMGFIIEENFDTDDLEKILQSIQDCTKEAGVSIVTADTKVIEGNGLIMINTSGIGFADREKEISISKAVEGDVIIVSGNLGDHHACILSSRMGIQNNIKSDAAPLNCIVDELLNNQIPVHVMRDVTRGGLATVLNEIASASKCQICIDESELPVSKEVNGLCKILGLDPLYMGNEGKLIVVVPKDRAADALGIIQKTKYGKEAKIIGNIKKGEHVLMKTRLGSHRMIDSLSGEGLPRIC